MTIVERGIRGLRQALGEMAAAAGEVLGRALAIVQGEDTEPGAVEGVLHSDLALNEFELRIDHMCEALLALQEPYAVDFRVIFSAIKTTRDLERIGDESKVVARYGAKLGDAVSPELHRMGTLVREAFDRATRALLDNDVAEAEAVLAGDAAIDGLEAAILAATKSVPEAFAAHALERIGDRAKNIGENVIYVVRAQDVRHRPADGG